MRIFLKPVCAATPVLFLRPRKKESPNSEKLMVIATAKLVLTSHRFPASKYAETKKFFDDVFEDGNQKLVIKKL